MIMLNSYITTVTKDLTVEQNKDLYVGQCEDPSYLDFYTDDRFKNNLHRELTFFDLINMVKGKLLRNPLIAFSQSEDIFNFINNDIYNFYGKADSKYMKDALLNLVNRMTNTTNQQWAELVKEYNDNKKGNGYLLNEHNYLLIDKLLAKVA